MLDQVEDRTGLQAIKLLHQQLDDDKDGTIEPFETGDFIKADLKVTIILMYYAYYAILFDRQLLHNMSKVAYLL